MPGEEECVLTAPRSNSAASPPPFTKCALRRRRSCRLGGTYVSAAASVARFAAVGGRGRCALRLETMKTFSFSIPRPRHRDPLYVVDHRRRRRSLPTRRDEFSLYHLSDCVATCSCVCVCSG